MSLENHGGHGRAMRAGFEAARSRLGWAVGAFAMLLALAVVARPVLSHCASNIGSVYLSRSISLLPDKSESTAAAYDLGFGASPSPAVLRGISLALPATSPDALALLNAERWLQFALQLDLANGSAHCGLGWVRATQGDMRAAALEWSLGGLQAADFRAYARAAQFTLLPELGARYTSFAEACDLLGATQ